MFRRRFSLSYLQRWRQFLWPRAGWARAFTYMWRRAIRTRASAHSIALGFAGGAFVSASPLIGLHIVYAWLICWAIGGNYLAAALGTWVGNPITFPFIWAGSYSVGNYLLGDNRMPLDFENLTLGTLWNEPASVFLPIFVPFMLGSFPVGLMIAVIIYYSSVGIIHIYQKKYHKGRL
ncbi:MAG: DUF2062 domain-containing protein [Alphaproteobacteria bacterium]|nr:DUF2062 domain-containing protein [Alphaproteobacteria bacterium]MBE8221047.1 DUF2062 domain-containing protein [Alphaproteobacteria bacterium]